MHLVPQELEKEIENSKYQLQCDALSAYNKSFVATMKLEIVRVLEKEFVLHNLTTSTNTKYNDSDMFYTVDHIDTESHSTSDFMFRYYLVSKFRFNIHNSNLLQFCNQHFKIQTGFVVHIVRPILDYRFFLRILYHYK